MSKLITIALLILSVGLYPAYAHQVIETAATLTASVQRLAGVDADGAFPVVVLVATVIMVARWR